MDERLLKTLRESASTEKRHVWPSRGKEVTVNVDGSRHAAWFQSWNEEHGEVEIMFHNSSKVDFFSLKKVSFSGKRMDNLLREMRKASREETKEYVRETEVSSPGTPPLPPTPITKKRKRSTPKEAKKKKKLGFSSAVKLSKKERIADLQNKLIDAKKLEQRLREELRTITEELNTKDDEMAKLKKSKENILNAQVEGP